jgi:hypothetical protein
MMSTRVHCVRMRRVSSGLRSRKSLSADGTTFGVFAVSHRGVQIFSCVGEHANLWFGVESRMLVRVEVVETSRRVGVVC